MENICIIIQKLSGGGAERVAANMSIELSKYYNITLIVFDATDSTYITGGNLIDLKLPAVDGKFGKIINIIKRSIMVKRIKRDNNISCSISLMEGANIVNILSKYKDKIIISERNLISFFLKSKLSKMKERIIAKKADKIVSLSEVVKNDLIENFQIPEKKIITIYNSVDEKKLLKNIETNNVVDDTNMKYIVTMGRLTYQKGQWHLLKAFKYVKENVKNIKLVILGCGELHSELLEYSKRLGIEKDVIFLGFIENPHRIIEKAELFVFSSIVEGLGNVLLEAMACGAPIISTDCDAGPREIISPKTRANMKTNEIEIAEYGILTPVFDKKELDIDNLTLSDREEIMGKAIVKLLLDEELKLHYAKMSKIRASEFSPEKITNQWKRLIDNIIMKGN